MAVRAASKVEELPEKGVYTLITEVREPLEVEVGSLGRLSFKPGFYLYTGSGLGPGPLSLRGRVRRHLGARVRAFWHIDYLLGRPEVVVRAVVAAPSGEKLECTVNMALLEGLRAGVPARGFGSSDCRSGCPAHLLFAGGEDPTEEVAIIYLGLGLKPVVLEVGGAGEDKGGRAEGHKAHGGARGEMLR